MSCRILVLLAFCSGALFGQPIRVMLVTGGHDHEPSFYSLFEGDDRLAVSVNPHPGAFTSDMRDSVDVLVLFDMVPEIEPPKRAVLQQFVESGKGVVSLHHSIGDYQNWPWWYEEVVGARYRFEASDGASASSFLHDQEIAVRPVRAHPITSGLGPFHIHDETYKGLWISPKAQVLLETDNPTSDGPLAWVGPCEKSRVVYIQLGHDGHAYRNAKYRTLLRNAIVWAAGK